MKIEKTENGNKIIESNKFWLVWTPKWSKHPSNKRYTTEELALKEARTLSKSNPNQDFYVVKPTHTIITTVKTEERTLDVFQTASGEIINVGENYLLHDTQEKVEIIAIDHELGDIVYKKRNGKVGHKRLTPDKGGNK